MEQAQVSSISIPSPIQIPTPTEVQAASPTQDSGVNLMPGDKFAGLGIRTISAINDIIIYLFTFSLFFYYFSLNDLTLANLLSSLVLLLSVFMLGNFIYLLIFNTLFTSFVGTTLGKFSCGLKVISMVGSNLSLNDSLFRTFIGYPTSAVFWGFGYLAINRDKNKQGWHDKVSGSFVVHKVPVLVSFASGVLVLITLLMFHYFILSRAFENFAGQYEFFKNDADKFLKSIPNSYGNPILRKEATPKF